MNELRSCLLSIMLNIYFFKYFEIKKGKFFLSIEMSLISRNMQIVRIILKLKNTPHYYIYKRQIRFIKFTFQETKKKNNFKN